MTHVTDNIHWFSQEIRHRSFNEHLFRVASAVSGDAVFVRLDA